jgi:hypothetical protein
MEQGHVVGLPRRDAYNRLGEPVVVPRAFGVILFCVALRSQPSHLPVSGHPVVNISFAGKAADGPDFNARDSCLNLPFGLSDPLWLEYDAR